MAPLRREIGPGRYLAIGLGGASVLLGLLMLLVLGSQCFGRETLPYQTLVDYQIAKLAHPVEGTLFLGDSSLGNAIDAALWSKLTGARSTNLALTGAQGIEGSHAMLARAVRKGKPSRVVIMHTAEILVRRPSDIGRQLASDDAQLSLAARFRLFWTRTMNVEEVVATLKWVRRSLLGRGRSTAARVIENDYVRQGQPITMDHATPGFSAGAIVPEHFSTLARIAQLCRTEGIDCVFAFGPLAEPLCSRSLPYFAVAAMRIRAAGLAVAVERPPCLAPHEVGDSLDHVHPAEKSRITRLYFERIVRH